MIKKIVLAGGCFWGMQELIRKRPGVVKTRVGYAGGKVENPTYDDHEGHAEAGFSDDTGECEKFVGYHP